VKAAIEQAARELGQSISAARRPDRADNEQALLALLHGHVYEPVQLEPGVLQLRNCPFDAVALPPPSARLRTQPGLIQGILTGLGANNTRTLLAPQNNPCCVTIRTTALQPNTPPAVQPEATEGT
jgi:hypothetical protein